MSRISLLALAGAAGLALSATGAWAHPKLIGSLPAAGAVVSTGPSEIRLTFNEGLEPSLSGIDIKNQAGEKITLGKASLSPTDKKELVIPLPAALADGTYSVEWHAVAADSHRVKGSYSFTVKH
jgi:methionine-rich copper-binding protein CopC